MKSIASCEGLLLEIDYDQGHVLEGPIINSARVLDSDYRATGPNLVPMLDKMFFLKDAANGEPFLNMVAQELAAG